MRPDPYMDPRLVALRHKRGVLVCIDEECELSGGAAHAGPCEPCACPLEHAVEECPEGEGFEARVRAARANPLKE